MPATHSTSDQTLAFAALENVKFALERFAVSIAPELRSLDRIEGVPCGGGEAWIVQMIQDHLREQYPDALSAAREWSDTDPLAVEVLVGEAA